MFDQQGSLEWAEVTPRNPRRRVDRYHNLAFAISKRLFDYGFSIFAMPIVSGVAGVLLLVNPFLNPGPLFYVQPRMGKHGQPFNMIKFRTMLPEGDGERDHTQGVETHRMTKLGSWLRKFRIDELPNLINVLRTEMSVVGPRPDTLGHAVEYSKSVPLYRDRHRVRPGITGLAQVTMGYAEGVDATAEKARLDHNYTEGYGFRQEARIILATIRVVLTGFGGK